MTPNPVSQARQSIREASYAYPQSTGETGGPMRQSVREALADAETLRRSLSRTALAELDRYADRAGVYMTTHCGEVAAYFYAFWAARQSFRAVPGLRGEEES